MITYKTRNQVEDELKKVALKNCKKCYGRGYVGFIRETNTMIACKCTHKKDMKISDVLSIINENMATSKRNRKNK